MTFIVTYRNHGKPEKTRLFTTYEEAEKIASFLRFQGATSIRVRQEG